MTAESPPSKAARRAPARLDRETIVDAALALGDREGPTAVTMRRLGAELGVDPTAVYRHFRSKQELLDAVADHLLDEMQLRFVHDGDWRSNLRQNLLLGFRLYRAHPGLAVELVRQRDDTPTLLGIAEAVIRELRAAGLSDHDAAFAFHSAVDVVVGGGLFYAFAPERDDPSVLDALRRTFAALSSETHPSAAAVAAHVYPDDEDVFCFTVELLLDAIELRAARTGGAPTKEEGQR